MKGTIRKAALPALALILGMSTFLAACSSNETAGENAGKNAGKNNTAQTADSNAKAPEPVTLKVMLFGEKPADLEKVLAKFEEETKDTLNTKLNIEYNPPADHKQKMQLKMSTGESVDLMFDAPWMFLYNNVSQGYYQQLDKYFNNDEYPGLKQAFPSELIEANKINGHSYTIPFMTSYSDPFVINIRKDIREELGLPPVKTLADYKNYLEKVQEKHPDYVPAAIGGRGIYRLGIPEEKGHNDIRLAAVVQDSFTGGIPFSVALSADGKKMLGAATIGDPDSEFASFPAPFNTHDSIYGHFGLRTEFRKFNNKDPLSAQANSALDPAKNASTEGTINGLVFGKKDLKKVVPNGDLEPFFYTSQDIADMKPGAIRTDFRANNSVVIPASSKNIDRTMKFLDWLYSSKDNHDLFELGIEGEHWVKDGDNGYKTTDKTTNYLFQGYELTWNPTLSRINTDNDPETIKYIQYTMDKNSYYQIPLSGFVFDSKPVATEIAQIKPKLQETADILMTGLEPKWKELAQKSNSEWRQLGLEKVRAEVIKQVQAYLDAGGK
ncbi:extracellular solute-binding protein [Paenibacillus sp. sptzw28]|uniref:extracellular solute-binding protein n=1 Tax=Paenibacillus sp. sptzw28 TaxID=715179 RepID=UPI001C6DF9FE|nr:extracellular solute-binding protein [Paenibacillus sp. sptzw28]QYR22765.1 extracellular solute-binding protein [Paenibacillus sp. sptzw28]